MWWWRWQCLLGLMCVWGGGGVLPPSARTLCEAPPCDCARGRIVCACSAHTQKDIVIQAEGYASLPLSISSIRIENCLTVHITTHSLEKLEGLRRFEVANVSKVVVEEMGFSWGKSEVMETYSHHGIDIVIDNASIPELPSYAFRGRLNSVVLHSLHIGAIRKFSFSGLAGMEKLELIKLNVVKIEGQAFKKFSLEKLVIDGGHFATLPSRMMVDIEVYKDVRFNNVTIESMKSSAVRIHSPVEFHLMNCQIGHMEEEAFRLHARGPVFIRGNVFSNVAKGAFVGFTVDHHTLIQKVKQDYIFENNTMEKFEAGALLFNTSGFDLSVDRIVLASSCSCSEIQNKWRSRLVLYSDTMQSQIPVEGVTQLMYCSQSKHQELVSEFERLNCKGPDFQLRYYIIFGLVGMFILAVILLYVFIYRRRAKRYINVPTGSPLQKEAARGGFQTTRPIVVVPEGKTYRETELHVIVERPEPISEFMSSDIVHPPSTPPTRLKTLPDSTLSRTE